MKILRAFALIAAVLIPAAAFAEVTQPAASCCGSACCHHGCPFCPGHAGPG